MILPPPLSASVRTRPLSILVATVLATAGCRKPEIQSYIAPRDEVDEPQPVNAAMEDALPSLSWSLPAGWQALGPDNMNAARFSAATAEGEISVMVTPLPNMSGQESMLVNMWRQTMGLPLLDGDETVKNFREVELAGGKGQLFEVTGKRGSEEMKIMTALLHRETKTWFFKMQGAPKAVEAQAAVFAEFLKSLKFGAPAAKAKGPADAIPAKQPAPVPVPPAPAPDIPASVPGTPPASWTPQAPGPMQAAKFSLPEKDGAGAEATVSVFPNDTGGVASNVARWRKQLGLPPADEAAIKASVKPMEGLPEGAVMVEMENTGRVLIGAIVPRSGRWYFYKLTGGAAAVAAGREAFINYCKAGS